MHRLWLIALLAPTPLLGQTADEKKATIRFLASLQQPDGGFVASPVELRRDGVLKSSLRATSGAVRAIKYLGGEVPNNEKAIQFVKSCFNPEKWAFADRPNGMVDVTSTAVGLMAAAELYRDEFVRNNYEVQACSYLVFEAKTFEERRLAVAGMEPWKFRSTAFKEWFAEIEKTRNPDGTYGKGDGLARETGSVVAMILRSGGELSADHRVAVLTAVKNGQRPDGGFGKTDAAGSDMETTYRVMRAFHLLKEKPKDVEKLRTFGAKHRNADGGYGTAPGQASNVSGTYYAAVIGYWLEK
jgi:hypothetical protein